MRMPGKRITISLICGVVAAALMAGCIFSIQHSATQSRAQMLASYGGEQIEIYIATRNIAAGEKLTTTNVTKKLWLVDFLPTGAITEESEVIGQTLGMPLFANEPVILAKIGTDIRPVNVPEGYCAVSIPTNDVLAVGGTITTGSVIAIYAADKESVVLLLAEVLVLDTSNSGYESYESSGLFGGSRQRPALTWVTLAIREDMVEDIIVASRTMNLYLVLPGSEV